MTPCWNCGHAMEASDDWQGRVFACAACGVDLTASLFAEGNAWALQKCRDVADLRKRLAVAERERDTLRRVDLAARALIRAWDRPIAEGDPRQRFDTATIADMVSELRKAAGLEG